MEDELRECIRQNYERVKAETGYNASQLNHLVESDNIVDSVIRWVTREGSSDGLTELYTHGRLDLSLEVLVLEDRWQTIIPENVRNTVTQKLEQLGYEI